MAGKVSSWTNQGTNLDAVDVDDALSDGLVNPTDNGIAENAPGEVANTGVISTRYMDNTHPRYECHMWLDADALTQTQDFNWPVDGDLTITFNATKRNLGASPGNCTAQVLGSIDGTTYVELKALGTTTVDNAVIHYVYDYDAEGRMPHMALAVTPAQGDDRSTTPIKIVVTPH